MSLHDIAPRLARARDQWERQQAAIAAHARRLERQEHAADGHAKCPRTGKRHYRSMETAEHALAHLILHTVNQRPCRAYECRFCGSWHLTSQPRREAVRA